MIHLLILQNLDHIQYCRLFQLAASSTTSSGSIFSVSSGPRSKIRSSASFTVCHLLIEVLPQNYMYRQISLIYRPKAENLIGVVVLVGCVIMYVREKSECSSMFYSDVFFNAHMYFSLCSQHLCKPSQFVQEKTQ